MKKQQKILIIEDNLENMYMLTFLLTNNDFEVAQAFNGEDAIKMSETFLPDIILLDIQLPVMNGYEIAEKLKQIEKLKQTPIIAVTSYAMAGDKERIMKAGASGYIEKPINPETFIYQMESFL